MSQFGPDIPHNERVAVEGSYVYSKRSDGNLEIVLRDTSHYRGPSSRPHLCVLPWPMPNTSSSTEELSRRQFMATFASGFRVIQTTYLPYLSGFQAIAKSAADQHPQLRTVDIEGLRKIRLEEDIANSNPEAVLDDDSSLYSGETLSAILYKWGCENRLTLRLGFVCPQGVPVLTDIPTSNPALIIWILNVTVHEGIRDAPFGHFAELRNEMKPFLSDFKHWRGLRRVKALSNDNVQIAIGPLYDRPSTISSWVKGPFWTVPTAEGHSERIFGPETTRTAALSDEALDKAVPPPPTSNDSNEETETRDSVLSVSEGSDGDVETAIEGIPRGNRSKKRERRPQLSHPGNLVNSSSSSRTNRHIRRLPTRTLGAQPSNAPNVAELQSKMRASLAAERSNSTKVVDPFLEDLDDETLRASIDAIAVQKYQLRRRQTPSMQRSRTSIEDRVKRYEARLDANLGTNVPYQHLKPREVFEAMMEAIREHYGDRFESYVTADIDELFENLKNFFTLEAWAVLESGDYSSENLLSIASNQPLRGIYLHIIWCNPGTENHWLYAGQSVDMPNRIADHQNPEYRKLNPSLHYAVWDSLREQQEVQDRFIYLCDLDRTNQPLSQMMVNLLEMFVALTLQILGLATLRNFLPETALRPTAGKHLMVAVPLFQSSNKDNMSREQLLEQIYATHDPVQRAYFNMMSQQFRDMKNSPDAKVREYYKKRMREGMEKRLRNVHAQLRVKLLQGTWIRSSVYLREKHSDLWNAWIWTLLIAIPRDLAHPPAKPKRPYLWIKCELAPVGASHPSPYFITTDQESSAARLGIYVTGIDDQGHVFGQWLQRDTQERDREANTIVDLLEGATWDEIQRRPNRFLVWKAARKLRATMPQLITESRYTIGKMSTLDRDSTLEEAAAAAQIQDDIFAGISKEGGFREPPDIGELEVILIEDDDLIREESEQGDESEESGFELEVDAND